MPIRVNVAEVWLDPDIHRAGATTADSSTAAGYIICIFALRFFENFATSQAIAS